VPVVRSEAAGGPDAGPGLAEHFEHRFRPISAGVAVPVFAFFAAGVTVGGLSGLVDALQDRSPRHRRPAWSSARRSASPARPGWCPVHPGRAGRGPRLADVVGLALLGGIGFTVSLLIGELAFGAGTPTRRHVKVGVLVGTLPPRCWPRSCCGCATAATAGSARRREVDADADGVPDVYQRRSAEG
jgi:NhaA family Na+:H+ antiporter